MSFRSSSSLYVVSVLMVPADTSLPLTTPRVCTLSCPPSATTLPHPTAFAADGVILPEYGIESIEVRVDDDGFVRDARSLRAPIVDVDVEDAELDAESVLNLRKKGMGAMGD